MVIVKLSKCILVWSEKEFLNHLNKNPDFFERGIKNGKYYKRREANERRKERRIYRDNRRNA